MIDPTPLAVEVPGTIVAVGATGMSAGQQFVLAMLGLVVTPIISVITLYITRSTHAVVNSRMDEFKTIWTTSAEKSMMEFKKALQDQALLAAQGRLPVVEAETK